MHIWARICIPWGQTEGLLQGSWIEGVPGWLHPLITFAQIPFYTSLTMLTNKVVGNEQQDDGKKMGTSEHLVLLFQVEVWCVIRKGYKN